MTQPAHRVLGMTDEEYEEVMRILDREPEPAELAMYSVMWSEHCSYKSSRVHLGRLPSEAPWVVVGPGENAGVVDIGDDWLVAFRIESHNHPSFVEPYQGAATGVGGILRDVLTMGARPIALLDAIRFGNLDDPHQRYLFDGVVRGIAGYGNAVGVPTVGGELEFDDAYAGNPLVNVMCVGLLRREQLVLSAASGAGNLAVLLGSATGRDGIGGASILASASFDEHSGSKRPSVQVGDPFEEKRLIEVCLELYERELVVGIQDLGAAGIACATSETAAAGGMGMEVDLDAVHVREADMTPGEMLMSESQERMLAIVRPEDLDEVVALAAKWDIAASVIGTVVPGGRLRVRSADTLVADIPAASLSEDAPRYQRPVRRPDTIDHVWARPVEAPSDPTATLLELLSQPDIGDPRWVYEQYDHQLFLGTVVPPGGDGSLLRVLGTDKGLAVTVDGDGRRCALDPRRGAARLVWEAALNVACTGARPLALVDNLNLGNPEKPEVMWQLSETVDGLAEACSSLGIPVVGGNVSLYNETDGRDIHPTPVVGMLGLADPMPNPPPSPARIAPGQEVWLVGPEGDADLAGSATQKLMGQHHGRPHPVDAAMGTKVVEAALSLAPVASALHDVSRGGLAVALAEICIAGGAGIEAEAKDLFGEGPHRFLAVGADLAAHLSTLDVPHRRLGVLEGPDIRVGSIATSLATAADTARTALSRIMETAVQ